PEPGSNSPRVRLALRSNRCLTLSHETACPNHELFGSSSPRYPEQAPAQRARLAHPDSQIRLSNSSNAKLRRIQRQPRTIPHKTSVVNPSTTPTSHHQSPTASHATGRLTRQTSQNQRNTGRSFQRVQGGS